MDLRYLAELIDIYTINFPEFYKPLTEKILQDLPQLVEVAEDSLPINVQLLSSKVPYTPDRTNCNPLTFSELKRLIDDILNLVSIIPANDITVKLAEIDVTTYYDDIYRPDNTYFTIKDDKLLVLKVDPIDFLDAAEILDKLQAQQFETVQAQTQNRKPKLILSQKWLFELLIPRLPKLLTCHPNSPAKIDVSKTGTFEMDKNPLAPFEISQIINMILKVSGVLPDQLAEFR